MNRFISAHCGVLGLALALALAPGCATKKFVVQEYAALDGKIDEVGRRVDVVGQTVEAHRGRLREHDDKLTTIGELVGRHDSQLKAVDAKIEQVRGLVRGRLIVAETARGRDAKFGFDEFRLLPEATAAIDAFVGKLIDENRGVFLEIQGHTDSTGPEEHNLVLGQQRADAVREYLYKHHHIPLHRMDVISLGSSQPLTDNATRDGRAMNRRVEILVYE